MSRAVSYITFFKKNDFDNLQTEKVAKLYENVQFIEINGINES